MSGWRGPSLWPLALLACLSILLGGCGQPARPAATEAGSTAGPPPVQAPSRREVRLAYVSTATTFAPLWAAHEYGLLEQYGLHAGDLYYISGGPAIAQALVAGDLDAAYSAFSSEVTAIMGGATQKVVVGFSQGFVHQLFTKEGTGVRQAQDMKGKRAGVSRLGAETHTVIQMWARAHGLAPDDIIYVNAGGAGERLAALDVGSIDLVPLDPPQVVEAQKRGYLRIADMTQEAVPWQGDGLAFREQTLQADPALVKAVVQALSEAAYLIRAEPERFQAVVGKYIKLQDPDALNAAYTTWRHG